MATDISSRSRIHLSKLNFEDRCSRAQLIDCAHELATLLGAIGTERGREREKQEAFQSVLERKVDVGPVALQCLFHLSLLGAEAHRRAVYTILDRGYNRDTDHIYGGAIKSLLALPDLDARDLQFVATALHGSTAELRGLVWHAVNSLDLERLRVVMYLNHVNILECRPFARALQGALEVAKVRAESIEASLPALPADPPEQRRC